MTRAFYAVTDCLGWALCESAFKTDCWGPMRYAYSAGCWMYGLKDKS